MHLSFAESAARFGHTDGVVAAIRLDYPHSVEFDIRYYPWWEHPKFQDAVARGVNWAFSSMESANRVATIRAIDLEVVHLCGDSATDITLTEDDPLLWENDIERAIILVNTDVNRRLLREALLARMRAEGRPGGVDTVLEYLAFRGEPTLSAPASLGYLPRQLYPLVRGALADLGVEVLDSEPCWRERAPRRLLQVDESYVIARDIVSEIPDFEHPDALYTGE